MKKKRYCSNCVNLINKRLTINDNGYFVDGNIRVVNTYSSPSKKKKCTECGNKVRDYFKEL